MKKEALLRDLAAKDADELVAWALEFLAAKDTSQYALRTRFPDYVPKSGEREWKPVYGYTKLYEVSNCGEVRNKENGKLLRQSVLTAGHRQVSLRKGGKSTSCYVHRVVASAFLTKPNSTHIVVNHIDGNPANNCTDNLEWTTQKKNIKQPSKEVRRLETLKNANKKSDQLKKSLQTLAKNYARLLDR